MDIRGSVAEVVTPHIKPMGLHESVMKLVIVELTVVEIAVSELGMGVE